MTSGEFAISWSADMENSSWWTVKRAVTVDEGDLSPRTNAVVLRDLKYAANELSLRAWGVGGYVRDHLLGRPTHDMDVVVEGTGDGASRLALRFAELVGASAPALFPRFGTAHVTHDDWVVEFVSAGC